MNTNATLRKLRPDVYREEKEKQELYLKNSIQTALKELKMDYISMEQAFRKIRSELKSDSITQLYGIEITAKKETVLVETLNGDMKLIDKPFVLYHYTIHFSLIKAARINAGLDFQDALSLLEVPQKTYTNWESGIAKPAKWIQKLILEKFNQSSYKNSPTGTIICPDCGKTIFLRSLKNNTCF